MYRYVYNKVLPAACSLCDLPSNIGIDLCTACLKTLPHNTFCCETCALPLPQTSSATVSTQQEHGQRHNPDYLPATALSHSGLNQLRCGKCLSASPLLSQAIVPYLYQAPVDYMIKRLKFSGDMKFSRIMGELLASAVKERLHNQPVALIPVPQHHDRLLERGYNQAQQIAEIVSQRLHIPIDSKCTERVLYQPPQATLNARDRAANIRRAFSVCADVKGKDLIIIDDVYTTGATTNALARVLLKAGAERVSVWAFARTP